MARCAKCKKDFEPGDEFLVIPTYFIDDEYEQVQGFSRVIHSSCLLDGLNNTVKQD